MKSDLRKVKVGDKIFTIESGWTKVIDTDYSSKYPVETKDHTYTLDGKVNIGDQYPTAFLEYPFKEQPIEKDTLVWFRDDEDTSWMIGYYSHFDDVSKRHCCFLNSKKSTEIKLSCSWKIVTTENPLI